MAKSSFYPPADKTTQWWENDFERGYFTKIEKILLHMTQTTGWPSYKKVKAGDIAPNLTYDVKSRKWRQHNYLDTSSRALGDPDSTPVRENRDNVIQIEIIWFAENAESLPDTAYQDLAAFIAYVRKEWGGPSLNYTAVGGPNDDVHLSSAAYDAFNGILGHANAPKPSTHWDPGKMNYAKLVNYVKKLEAPVAVPTAVTIDSNFDDIGSGGQVTLTASVTPVAATGVADFLWKNGDNWVSFGKVPVVNGKARIVNAPWANVRYGVVFRSDDQSKFQNSQAYSVVVNVHDIGDLVKRVEALEGKA